MLSSKYPDDSPRGFWYGLINFEHRLPTPDDFKLDRMRKLLDLLGNPEKKLKFVHVAGSKGKGSTSAMLAAILSHQGLRTGLYTSPHLFNVEERFSINGQIISPDSLDLILAKIKKVIGFPECKELGFIPTFFEVATVVAFIYFLESKVDLAILEVGLGGRLDSTNICNPLLSIVTTISFDHEKQLGPTLIHIAREKAGIIKPGVPVISGVCNSGPREVMEDSTSRLGAKLVQANVDFTWDYHPGSFKKTLVVPPSVQIKTREKQWPLMELSLLGEHQAANAALVVSAVEELRFLGVVISDEAVRWGLGNTVWPARMQVMCKSPLVVVDCAHNRASAAALVRTIKESFPEVPRVLLFGASADKDISGMFQEFSGIFNKVFFAQSINSPRAAKPSELLDLWTQNSTGEAFLSETLEEAGRKAFFSTPNPGILCITGSVFLAGEISPILLKLISEK
ncbi:MAG: bifunctional folylpolyglutamate synthase/dihydrofolate synthase [Planctomycetes bacterium]|nr:bifunctional folylpolyglutamate synthase/dihydrofolate synthase [Planctomycetota bacterium]NBY02285.1 bifunctional folylpolyglutamate synthase/dihydrofolate synthase [Planctomycetota bacterium]